MYIPSIDLRTAQRNYDVARVSTASHSDSYITLARTLASTTNTWNECILRYEWIHLVVDLETECSEFLKKLLNTHDWHRPSESSNSDFEKFQASQTPQQKIAMANSAWHAMDVALSKGMVDGLKLRAIARDTAIQLKIQHETVNANVQIAEMEGLDDYSTTANPDLARAEQKIEAALQIVESKIKQMKELEKTVRLKIEELKPRLDWLNERYRHSKKALIELKAIENSAKVELEKISNAYIEYVLQHPDATEVPEGFHTGNADNYQQEHEYASQQSVIASDEHFRAAHESDDGQAALASQVICIIPMDATQHP